MLTMLRFDRYDPTRSFPRKSLGDSKPKTLSSSGDDRDRCSVS
jgi:hypothetical protein